MPVLGVSQNNAHFQYRDIIGSDYHQGYISSAAVPSVISNPEFGNFQIIPSPTGLNTYTYSYQPGVEEGSSKAVIEYYKIDSETGLTVPDYTTIFFTITKSIISCGDDRETIQKNGPISFINVLENDSRSDGPLTLSEILYSEGGIASIANGKISFIPSPNFEGDAFVYYSVKDAVGKSGTGVLKIKVLDYSKILSTDEISVVSYGGESVELDFPFDGFVPTTQPQYGKFESLSGVQKYTPYQNTTASETIVFTNGNITREVYFRLVEKEEANSWVVDDVRYTSKGTPVTLNVTDNDYIQNQTIIDHSSDLIPGGDEGEFTYSPSKYFTGTKDLEYTVYNGYDSETGTVTIHVNNFNPITSVEYNFTTVGNSALVIDYNIPIENYSFSIVSQPDHGSLVVNSGNSMIDVGCEIISGRNLILYEPSWNYTGEDDFRIKYCVDGKCKYISISVNVIPNELSDCKCFTGCVWSGDANNDGVVNSSDLITAAYAIGSSGAETEWNGANGWIGRKTSDWLDNSLNGVNAKFADADGNGIVDELDFDAIYENYNQNHALIPPQTLNNKSYPFSIVPTQDTVFAGDIISFEIGIGNDQNLALDVNGLVYNLGFSSALVDSASVNLEYYSDSWFGVDEKVIGIFQQVRPGFIETAVSRLGVNAKSGAGKLGKLDFIVEEDVVGGFRVGSEGVIPVEVQLTDAQVMSSNGQLYSLPSAEGVVYLSLKKRSNTEEASPMLVFPNPASEEINLHMNGGHDIISYEIYSITGQLMDQNTSLNGRSESVNISNYNNGLYIVKANTTSGVRINKFEVF
ncbi:hypothetical protein GCM10007940_29440 [Portibacter lacus]|uniref:Secretion system C-terminal sorting domain-containing protein n=1 Tax=Portibacter lacus TaxID=1099794 RepID=A0AA37WF02_9BACT|nr:hypothetical protein GCM10007940_29440 [Portibacter lacus]